MTDRIRGAAFASVALVAALALVVAACGYSSPLKVAPPDPPDAEDGGLSDADAEAGLTDADAAASRSVGEEAE
jgi:hypothetical protein